MNPFEKPGPTLQHVGPLECDNEPIEDTEMINLNRRWKRIITKPVITVVEYGNHTAITVKS